jgi:hypothetical protein
VKALEKFNEAMNVYLELLKELNDYVISNNIINNKTNDFNYKIINDCINSYSIKYDQNYPDNWTHCMKYLLTILKSYIYFALKKEDNEYNEILEKSSVIINK